MSRSHGVVIGYRSEDQRRYLMVPPATIPGKRCIGCGAVVFVNDSGAQAFRDRDADALCDNCERSHHHDVNRSLIES